MNLWYKHHQEACFVVDGAAEITERDTGAVHRIGPGDAYAPRHDRHTIRVLEPLRLVCVFSPALTGRETHDADGPQLPARRRLRLFVLDDGEAATELLELLGRPVMARPSSGRRRTGSSGRPSPRGCCRPRRRAPPIGRGRSRSPRAAAPRTRARRAARRTGRACPRPSGPSARTPSRAAAAGGSGPIRRRTPSRSARGRTAARARHPDRCPGAARPREPAR